MGLFSSNATSNNQLRPLKDVAKQVYYFNVTRSGSQAIAADILSSATSHKFYWMALPDPQSLSTLRDTVESLYSKAYLTMYFLFTISGLSSMHAFMIRTAVRFQNRIFNMRVHYKRVLLYSPFHQAWIFAMTITGFVVAKRNATLVIQNIGDRISITKSPLGRVSRWP